MKRATLMVASVVSFSTVLVGGSVMAASPTKDECIDTHSRGQDARDRGQLAESKRLFLLCAQTGCPALIQSDCSKFGEELARSVPSVSFSARDAKGNDLPDTQVFVDGSAVTTRLDDGKAYDIDPGKHTVRFVHAGKETTTQVVIAVGERGRNLGTTFGEPPTASEAARPLVVDATTTSPSRSILPLVGAGIGGAVMVTGAVLLGVGLGGVPDRCSTSSHECAAPPGDPVFDDAASSVNLANVGIGLGVGGALLGVGSLIWYFTRSASAPASAAVPLAPALNARGGVGGLRLAF